jgi:hypothetical protein
LYKKRREIVLNHYGGNPPECFCCGETFVEFLSLDHINGGGRRHRAELKKIGFGGRFYLWLIKNNFPKEYRVLCNNCNMSLGFYGYCPHQKNSAIGVVRVGHKKIL